MIVLITGPSASGKTTIARELCEKYQFHLIDGDQVIRDLGLTSKAWNSIHDHLIDRALQVEPNIHVVISHVVILEKFAYYQEKMAKFKRDFHIVVFQPSLETLHDRSRVRKSHPKPTPQEFIDFFYDQFKSIKATNYDCLVIDNSLQSEQETLEEIVKYIGFDTND